MADPPRFSSVHVDLLSGKLTGGAVWQGIQTLAGLKGLFRDEEAQARLEQSTIVYRIQTFFPVREDQEGGLFWGATFLSPGVVGMSTL